MKTKALHSMRKKNQIWLPKQGLSLPYYLLKARGKKKKKMDTYISLEHEREVKPKQDLNSKQQFHFLRR